ncbi:polyphosphate kinase 2 family protein [Roseiconus nitratireducens]|uniref:Polyphosphate kinase 2 family protein n=1 Tax=Roseiconus nitratireducens TaxID=2605748 RepID=A0A5M6D8F5_9BACT|nr:polyphosphate kinase 2 family protein [Roseiconus nitratireducens]KAA5543838.1 polyphosphate kinase 2 family protein [Roseiconus nitratireducens]
MNFESEYRIRPNQQVSLDTIETRTRGPFERKSDGKAVTEENVKVIRDLQYRMFVEREQSLLIVLQAPDAAGKDGLIRKVLGKMNPQGCRTYPFKVPNETELAHDFLWRIHHCTPSKGKVAIFNRSHYEDVLVVRVENLVPKSVWSKRFELINDFERILTANGTRVLKFYLHISPEEQLERFKERLDNPDKHWKLNAGDYESRRHWDAFHRAYEEVFQKCSTEDAPWYVVPADRKWYRNAVVSSIVAKTLRDMAPQLPPVDVDLDEIRQLYHQAHARQQESS